jgi:hypothetical protein
MYVGVNLHSPQLVLFNQILLPPKKNSELDNVGHTMLQSVGQGILQLAVQFSFMEKLLYLKLQLLCPQTELFAFQVMQMILIPSDMNLEATLL